MTATERAVTITACLLKAYPDRRPLLQFASPFQLVIAVILSAQTTDAQVNKVTPELFRLYPSPARLAAARPEGVERLVHSTGFYQRKARNVVAAARALSERFGGEVPRSMEDLTSIPGMGRKSANVIRGVIYGEPSIVVDTHLTRVTGRLGLVSTTNPDRIERELRAIVPEALQTDFSMAVNLHGRARCTARKPACELCEIRSWCPYPASI